MKYASHWARSPITQAILFRLCLLARLAEHIEPARQASRQEARAGPLRRAKGSVGVRSEYGIDDGRVKRFLKHVWAKEKISSAEAHCIMNVCMAATYDPDPSVPREVFVLPCNLETGERIDKRWQQWLTHDPIHLVTRYARNLKSLAGIYIDCGWSDQFHIHYGTRYPVAAPERGRH